MPVPSYGQMVIPSSTANGMSADTVEERILSILAMLASGTGPDGTALPGAGVAAAVLPTAVNAGVSGPWGAGLVKTCPGPTQTGGAMQTAYSSVNGAANATTFQTIFTYAANNGLGVYLPPGTWDCQGQLKFLTSIPYLMGAGPDNTVLRFQTGAGRLGAVINPSTGASTGCTITTADGFGTGLQMGNNSGNYAGPGGLLADLTISGPVWQGAAPLFTDVTNPVTGSGATPTISSIVTNGSTWVITFSGTHGLANNAYFNLTGFTPNYNGSFIVASQTSNTITINNATQPGAITQTGVIAFPSSAVGVMINGVTQMTVARTRVTNFGIAYDTCNNSGGSLFSQNTSAYKENWCGYNFREAGALGSGSDFQFDDNWFHGNMTGFAVGPSCTDAWVRGGQIAANVQNGAGLAAANDIVAALTLGRRMYATTGSPNIQIGTDGWLGPNSVGTQTGLFHFQNVDFEGTRLGWCGFRGYGGVTVTFTDINFIAYDTGGIPVATPYGNGGLVGCTGVGKLVALGNQGGNNALQFLGNCQVKGSFASTTLLSLAGQTNQFSINEMGMIGNNPTSINGYGSSTASGAQTVAASFTLNVASTGTYSAPVFNPAGGNVWVTTTGTFTATELTYGPITTANQLPITAIITGNAGDSIANGATVQMSLDGSWLKVDALSNVPTNLVRFSGQATNYSADMGTGQHDLNGILIPGTTLMYAHPTSRGLKAWSMNPEYIPTNSFTLVSGTVYLVLLTNEVDGNCTQVNWLVSSAGATLTANENFVGLYSMPLSGTTAALLATSAAGAMDTQFTSVGPITGTIPSTPVIRGQQYFAAILANGTTPPGILRGSNLAGTPNYGLTSVNLKYQTGPAAQTTLPATLTLGTTLGAALVVALK